MDICWLKFRSSYHGGNRIQTLSHDGRYVILNNRLPGGYCIANFGQHCETFAFEVNRVNAQVNQHAKIIGTSNSESVRMQLHNRAGYWGNRSDHLLRWLNGSTTTDHALRKNGVWHRRQGDCAARDGSDYRFRSHNS